MPADSAQVDRSAIRAIRRESWAGSAGSYFQRNAGLDVGMHCDRQYEEQSGGSRWGWVAELKICFRSLQDRIGSMAKALNRGGLAPRYRGTANQELFYGQMVIIGCFLAFP